MNRNKYRQEWLRLHARYEREGRRMFRKALREAAMRIPFDNLDPFHYPLSIDFNITHDAIAEAYRAFYEKVGLSHGKRVGKGINKQLKNFDPVGFEPVLKDEVANLVRNELGKNITSVRSGLVNYLIKFFAEKVEEGMAVADIVREIQKHILSRGFYRWQIERIVRTETTTAANLGSVTAGSRTGIILEKEWISGLDARTRALSRGDRFDHLAMDGDRTDQYGVFEVPGKDGPEFMRFPGDQGGKIAGMPDIPQPSPGNVINCRCAVALVPKRDENGRLVRV